MERGADLRPCGAAERGASLFAGAHGAAFLIELLRLRRIMSEHQRRQDDNAVLYAGGRRPGGTGMSSNAHRSGAAEICRRSWRR